MKTLFQFNKGNKQPQITNDELILVATSQSILDYLKAVEKYEEFCRNQTKRGQARKNERSRTRQTMFNQVALTPGESEQLESLRDKMLKEKDNHIQKVTVEIEYDGRKASNLGKIIEGVKMSMMVGGVSPQYKSIGLINYKVIQ